ncbi:hypothetical protein [Massilia genomosp. 1]|uniref:hypothetical protein n=1 Tax=Massilia genomosp. 1 TaxID=2609280 RepID=UPI001423EC0D|nr:hypothetical protein [Massilia genomosp. 1]
MYFFFEAVLPSARSRAFRFLWAGIAAFIICSPLSARAEDGTYIGPFKYYYDSSKTFPDEGSAVAALLVEKNSKKEPWICDYFIMGKPGEWNLDTSVANIVSGQHRSYNLVFHMLTMPAGDCNRVEGGFGLIIYATRLVCVEEMGTRYFSQADECRRGEYRDKEDPNGSNVGPQCPDCDVGKPITP